MGMDKTKMRKRMLIMLICVGIVLGCIFAYKVFTAIMIKRYLVTLKSPTITVSAMQAEYSLWQPKLTASGSVRAIKGMDVTTELAGMVQKIYFTPGTSVEEGTLLVQLNADSDIAALHALEANAELAQITFERDKAQYAIHAVSKQTLDVDAGNLKNLRAQVAQQAATVAKKTIRAPFTGRLGVSVVNPGQYLNPGNAIVTLQSLDPIWVDFYMPQQALAHLRAGQTVTVTSDIFPGQTYTGKITTINPAVDVNTRNVQVEATVANPKYELTPGMFAVVDVVTGEPQNFITLPQTAISYNPYGNIVYLVKETGKDEKGPILTVTQIFVTTGETRGDQVKILQGLSEGDTVVTSGQLKLKNGSRVVIDNSIQPPNNPVPHLPNEH